MGPCAHWRARTWVEGGFRRQCLWGRVSCRQRLDVSSPLPPSRWPPLLLLDCPVPLRRLQTEACRGERSSGRPHRSVTRAQRPPWAASPFPVLEKAVDTGPLQPGLPACPSAAAGTREPPGPHTAGCAGACSCPLVLSPELCLSGRPQAVLMEPRTRSPPRSCKKP